MKKKFLYANLQSVLLREIDLWSINQEKQQNKTQKYWLWEFTEGRKQILFGEDETRKAANGRGYL